MKRKPLFAAAILVFTATLVFCGCGDNGDSSSEPTHIVVSEPTEEASKPETPFPFSVGGTVFEKSADKVVSLSPAVTEILLEMGFEDHLCGVSIYCDHVPKENECEYVGSAENPDIDKITELNPDAVLSLTPLSEREAYAIENAGIKLVILEQPYDKESYMALYRNTAAIFVGNHADIFGKSAWANLESAADFNIGSFIYVTPKLAAAGNSTFENAVLSLIGDNLCLNEGYVSGESLENNSPDYIIASDSIALENLTSSPPYSNMISSKSKVIFVSSVYFERPTAGTSEIFRQIKDSLPATSE